MINLKLKISIILIVMSTLPKWGGAQYNLIPNPSFEMLSIPCDSLSNEGGGASFWNSIIKGISITPSSYSVANTCIPPNRCCRVPFITSGYNYQYPRSGNSMIIVFLAGYPPNRTTPLNLRDYVQTKLKSSFIKNELYFIEFFVNNPNAWRYGINNIGVHLSDTPLTNTGRIVKPLPTHLLSYGNPVILDTLNWVKIAGIYKARGGEQYFTIGNFKYDIDTDTITNKSMSYGASYFIDDVSVIPLDSLILKADAGRDTTIYKGDSAWIGSRISGITDMHWRTAAGGIVADSVPGLWVKPTTTTIYILDQTIGGQYSKDTVKVTVVQPVPVLVVNGQLLVVKEGKAVEFSWQTANEVNLSHFVVEQSPDGLQYQAAGTVNANGSHRYRFEIPTASISQLPPFRGWGYYRLKMVDKDGRYSYSKTFSVPFSMLHAPLSIIPNPAKDQITITAKNVQRYQIIDNLGSVLVNTKAADGTQTIDVSGFSKGVYLVKGYSAEGNVVTGTFLKE